MPDYIVQVILKKDGLSRGKLVGNFEVDPSTKPKDHVATYSVRTTDPPSTVAGSVEAGLNTLTSPTYAG